MHTMNSTRLGWAVTANSRARGLRRAGGAAVFATLLAGPAVAQTTAQGEAPLEEVTVTGIRQSLSTSAELKRESAIVQDSISQEDLGKFPDANIAESLPCVYPLTARADR